MCIAPALLHCAEGGAILPDARRADAGHTAPDVAGSDDAGSDDAGFEDAGFEDAARDVSVGRDARPLDARTLRYFVIPHPDDEFESWSMLDGDASHYTVFILTTRGEQTGYCSGSGFQAAYGERAPQPQPFATSPNGGRWSATCAAERLDAWNYFLDRMGATSNPELGAVRFVGHFTGAVLAGDPSPSRCDALRTTPAPADACTLPTGSEGNCHSASGYDLWVGPSSARVAFDLGDGDLTPAEVGWAVRTVQRIAAQRFPVQAEDDVVAGSYSNLVAGNGPCYAHPDHRAIHDALWNQDLGTPGPQWARTSRGDTDAVLTRQVSAATMTTAMRVDGTNPATARRVGFHTVAYGWLSNPYYAGCASSRECMWSAEQQFWRRH